MKKIISLLCIIFVFFLSSCEVGVSNSSMRIEEKEYLFDNTNSPFEERIGITNWGAVYMPNLESNETSLFKGAEYIANLGSKVIKIACGNPKTQYPLDNFENNYQSSLDILKDISFKQLLDSNLFTTYFISVPEHNQIDFSDGVSKEEYDYVFGEFYDMTKYLLETYQNSGKVFILQNWETDNYLSYRFDGINDLAIMHHYVDYFNARLDGINKAREEFGITKEKKILVLGAIEINKLGDYDHPRAIDTIIPNVYADLFCYSSYEIKDKGVVSSKEDVKNKLKNLLEIYESKLPNINNYPSEVFIKDNRIAITEFGYPDKADNYDGKWQKMVVEGHLMALEECHLQYAIYWQLCCNEVVGDAKTKTKNLRYLDLRNYQFMPGDLNGFYLIRPDGVKNYTYQYLKKVFSSNSIDIESDESIPTWKEGK